MSRPILVRTKRRFAACSQTRPGPRLGTDARPISLLATRYRGVQWISAQSS
jgi:hypothetical protein